MLPALISLYRYILDRKLVSGAFLLSCLALILSVVHLTTNTFDRSESTLDRVSNAGTLRCVYLEDPQHPAKDLKANAPSGAAVDIVEELGRLLNVKISWKSETNTAAMIRLLKKGKADAVCSELIANPELAHNLLFTEPVYFSGSYAFVRVGDSRFDHSLDSINDHTVRVATLIGDQSDLLASQTFPKSQHVALAKPLKFSNLLDYVADGKADVTFGSIASAKEYTDHNPGKIKILTEYPAHAYPISLISVGLGEHDFAEALNVSLRSLEESGFIERTLRKYDPSLDNSLLVAKPYQSRDKYLW